MEFFNFFFLPKNTFLGPITGGKHIIKNYTFNSLVRKFIFPFFF